MNCTGDHNVRTLVCGSLAFDTIMVFPDTFKNHILPEQVHILNVCFMVPKMRREFGGCAGNISYNLRLLEDEPVPMGTVGSDFGPYRDWLRELGIPIDHISEIEETYTAQAFITTDLDDNQIIAFHPGAMAHAHANRVTDAADIGLGIVAPDGREAMIEHAEQFAAQGIPFMFDPGQGLPMFDRAELERFTELADWIVVNDYESKLLEEKLGHGLDAVAERVRALIVTLGGKGSRIRADGDEIEIPAAPVSDAVDPTGCGDAYRGGLLYGIANDFDWHTTGRIAALMGAIKIEQHGTQNHRMSRADISARFLESFGYAFD
jgi:adenosine kinase